MSRSTVFQITSGCRSTSVVDTPMRKVEVLEELDGQIILRETVFADRHVGVSTVHLQHHEAAALARALLSLEDMPETSGQIAKAGA